MLTSRKNRWHEFWTDAYPLAGLALIVGYLVWAAAR